MQNGKDSKLRLSYSAVSTYQNCPLKYKYHYIEKLPTKPSPALSFGSSVHEALHWFYDRPTPPAPSAEELVRQLERCWDRKGYKSKEEETRYFYQAKKALESFHEKFAGNFRIPMALEHKFLIDVGVCRLSGIIDRVDRSEDGRFEIIDYKTNRKIPALKYLKKDLQLPIYHIASKKVWGVTPEKVSFYYILHDHKVTYAVTDKWEDDTFAAIGEVVAGIKAGRFEPRKNPLCPWCDYKDICQVVGERDDVEVVSVGESVQPLSVSEAVDELARIRKSISQMSDRSDVLEARLLKYLRDKGDDRIEGRNHVLFLQENKLSLISKKKKEGKK